MVIWVWRFEKKNQYRYPAKSFTRKWKVTYWGNQGPSSIRLHLHRVASAHYFMS